MGPTPSFSSPDLTNRLPDPIYISIIIDDIGNNHRRGRWAIDLPAELTIAVIPDTTHAVPLATYANQSGKEVIIHMPMENLHHRPLGSIALTSALSRQEFRDMFDDALNRVPFAIGVNNHMGSALTQQPQAMSWLMESVRQHKLFFIDSRTTHKTVARGIAEQQNVLSASRDVFLDNERTLYSIDEQFRQLLKIAERRKTAIAIGHPYESTLRYLEQAIPLLAEENVQVIPVSRMLKIRRAQQQVASSHPTGAD
jgi:polysaccharide deacetylase 2 family uncharacterized protein YibQ